MIFQSIKMCDLERGKEKGMIIRVQVTSIWKLLSTLDLELFLSVF